MKTNNDINNIIMLDNINYIIYNKINNIIKE